MNDGVRTVTLDEGAPFVVAKACPICGNEVRIVVDYGKYRHWKGGALIQRVWPKATLDEREALMTGIDAACFKRLGDE